MKTETVLQWLEISRLENKKQYDEASEALKQTEDQQKMLDLGLELAFRQGIIHFCERFSAAIQAKDFLDSTHERL